MSEEKTTTEPALARFFAVMEPFLFGRSSVGEVEAQLGPLRSTAAELDFYRVLVTRNALKFHSELFATLRALVDREAPGLWTELVDAHGEACPSVARDPNWIGESFSSFLSSRRETHPEQPAVFEELADYIFCRFAASTAPDSDVLEAEGDRDGFERRLFVRVYTHAIPELLGALRQDPAAPLSAPQPSTVLVYRGFGSALARAAGVRWRRPDLAELIVLGRREGTALPGPLAEAAIALGEEVLAAAQVRLVTAGVLETAKSAAAAGST